MWSNSYPFVDNFDYSKALYTLTSIIARCAKADSVDDDSDGDSKKAGMLGLCFVSVRSLTY